MTRVVVVEYPEFGPFEPYLRRLVAGVCLYEAAAIWTRRVPTVSRLARQYPAASAAVLGVLAWHFQPRPVPTML